MQEFFWSSNWGRPEGINRDQMQRSFDGQDDAWWEKCASWNFKLATYERWRSIHKKLNQCVMFEKVGKYSRKCRIKETSICILPDPGSCHTLSTLTVTWLEVTTNFFKFSVTNILHLSGLSFHYRTWIPPTFDKLLSWWLFPARIFQGTLPCSINLSFRSVPTQNE